MLQPDLHIGVITALCREARLLGGSRTDLARVIQLGSKTSLYVSGMGAQQADRAASVLLDAGCQALVSFGTAGGLSREQPVGSLVIPDRVMDEQGMTYQVDVNWRERLAGKLMPGSEPTPQVLLSVARPVISAKEKQRLAVVCGACAVDMESVAIARFAERREIPWLVVRAVSDDCLQTIPAALLSALDVYGEPRWPALLRALCRHPGLVRRLPDLVRGVGAAERALAGVVLKAGIRFGA